MSFAVALKKINIPEKYRLPFAVGLSILLHLLLLLFSELNILTLKPAASDLLLVHDEEPIKNMVFRIVESNPEAETETPPRDAQFASDRNARAQDFNPALPDQTDIPVTEGLVESTELPSQVSNPSGSILERDAQEFREFKKPDLSGFTIAENQKEKGDGESSEESKDVKNAVPDNTAGSSREWGGFSLSTYEWDFAPYMLDLKKRVERNINPPSAFYMGLINGTYLIQFVISRSGDLLDIRVLESRGNKALETTSYNAIKYSDPFRPLPDDFPDDVLTVTGRFQFHNRR